MTPIPNSRPSANTLGASRPHMLWLDWVRFSAALLVVLTHARGGVWVDWGRLDTASKGILTVAFFAITRVGTEAVIVFFVLSGFFVGGKVLHRLNTGTFEIWPYVIDRVTRIWIPLVPALFLSGVVAELVGKRHLWVDLAGNLVGLQGLLVGSYAENYPLWSLAYEIWFYVLAGALAVAATRRAYTQIWALVLIAMCFGLFTKLAAVFLFAWFLGAVSYSCAREPVPKWSAPFGSLVLFAGCVISQLRAPTVSVNRSWWFDLLPSADAATLLFALGTALLLPGLGSLRPRNGSVRQIEAFGARLASFSYTLYLTHYPALYLWEHYSPQRYSTVSVTSVAVYASRIASCVALAWILYLPFERHTDRVRRFLSKHFVMRQGQVALNP